ncbi:hypothetical protein HBH56_221690 [Parastagonospora nodorum]|uniref:Uncharacterized protein n=1 Tax=Phaeosphaeria nodorum (strain SN15 / ATCC MYA-4574 / FGSC 10173) TaxID=321614 RepID=A0A7U2F1V9_PHANO|nr:hypothetical protein HBH56_221690 [Parastagonospora nodorum]QRC97180.1 hypothetical protein JI435_410230 [Parastagonospora nodorum SN15]KAH3924132.1 hypothetical protein HBH54_200060 [Parastagonospora nodorum]KAH3944627.1 hypothetical protein HBH53_156430 [Parastagonospora nodorum]KAH3963469.1 hypothetical protein HBH51_168270 [Parastagonospora nodorum]
MVLQQRGSLHRRFRTFTIVLKGSTTSWTTRKGKVASPTLQHLHMQHRSDHDGAIGRAASALAHSTSRAWTLTKSVFADAF